MSAITDKIAVVQASLDNINVKLDVIAAKIAAGGSPSPDDLAALDALGASASAVSTKTDVLAG